MEIEFSMDDGESGTQDGGAGEETETESTQAAPGATVRAPIQSKHEAQLEIG